MKRLARDKCFSLFSSQLKSFVIFTVGVNLINSLSLSMANRENNKVIVSDKPF